MTFDIGKELISEAEAFDSTRGFSIWYRSILFFAESCIAIDVACFIRIFGCNTDVQGRTDDEVALQAETHGNLLTCFFQFLAFLLDFNVLPLLVFEGRTPKHKEAEAQHRSSKRETAADEKGAVQRAIQDARQQHVSIQKILMDQHNNKHDSRTDAFNTNTNANDIHDGLPRALLKPKGVLFKSDRIKFGAEYQMKVCRAITHQAAIHRRNHFQPKRTAVDYLKELCRLMGLPFIQAPYEMDWEAGQLHKLGVILGAAGTDHDFICHDVPLVRDMQLEMYNIERLWYDAAYGSGNKEHGNENDTQSSGIASHVRPRDVVHVMRRVAIARPIPKTTKRGRGKKRKSDNDGGGGEDPLVVPEDVVPIVLPPYQVPGYVRVYDPKRVSEVFRLSVSQITDLCNIMGNDYCTKTGIRGVGFGKGRDLLHQHGSLDALLDKRPLPLPSNAALPCDTVEEFQQLARQARNIFLGHPDKTLYPEAHEHPTLTQPVTAFDIVALREFVHSHCMLPPRRYSGLSCKETSDVFTGRKWKYMYTVDDYSTIRTQQWASRMNQMEGRTTLPGPAQLRRVSDAPSQSNDTSMID